MDRRTLLSTAARATLLTTLPAQRLARAATAPYRREGQATARPTPNQVQWADLEFGIFIHFGNETYQDGRPHDFSVPAAEVNPAELSTDQWAETAVAAGAKYIVFVAKHQYGFCSWQTETTDFSLKGSPWRDGKGDIMAMLRASCDKYKLGLGIYLSPRDDHFGAATGGICKTAEEQAKYDKIYRQQLTELTTRYGPLVEIWFDGATATPVADILARYQPHAAVFQGPAATIRWVGNEDGFAPYPCWNGVDPEVAKAGTATALDSDPDGARWLPSEVDVSIRRPDWFWTSTNAGKVLSPEQLMSIYYRSVGRGGQLLLNFPPGPSGLIDRADVTSATTFGTELKRRFAQPLATTSGTGAELTLHLPANTMVDTIVLQEDIPGGERIRAYTLEALTGPGQWSKLGEGTAVGHKRIQPVTPAPAEAIRLRITAAAAQPLIRTLAAYNTNAAPPADWNAASALWSKNLIGSWKDGAFHLDLHGWVKEAAQYRLKLVPADGETITAIADIHLVLDNAEQPKLLKHVPGHPDELILDVTGLGDTGTISGKVEGATHGQALLQKM